MIVVLWLKAAALSGQPKIPAGSLGTGTDSQEALDFRGVTVLSGLLERGASILMVGYDEAHASASGSSARARVMFPV